jgi:hypothetical protein
LLKCWSFLTKIHTPPLCSPFRQKLDPNWTVNNDWKGYGRKQPWPNLKYYLAWRDCGKPQETLSQDNQFLSDCNWALPQYKSKLLLYEPT